MLDLPAAGIGARMYCNQEKKERVRGMTLRERAKTLKNETAALFIALRRADTPFAAKLAAGLAVGYALSPIDLVPDFIPVLGYLDDVIEPAETRKRLISAYEMLASKREQRPAKKHGNIPL